MTHKYLPGNEYHTPNKQKQSIWDLLSLGSSCYFNLKFLRIVLQNRRLAIKGKYDTAMWAHKSFKILRFIEGCKGRFHITGLNNLQNVKDEPVVFISNHMSTLETMIFPCIIAPVKEVTFVVKDSLTSSKLFGPIMNSRNPIAVGRKESRKDLITVLTEGQKRLNKGHSVIIFPQSTRTTSFEPEHFNSLGTKLASKAGVKVVPIAIKTDYWDNGRLFKDMGHIKRNLPIYIKIGKPIPIEGSGKSEHHQVVEFIIKNLENWSK